MADKVINIGNSDNKVTVNVTDKIVCPTFDGTATKVGHKLSFGNKTFDGSSAVVLSGADLGSVDLTSEQTIIGQKTFSGETYLDSLNANTGLISGNLRVINGIAGYLTGNVTGNLSGNASTATKLQTARTLTIGNTEKSFDGSSNISWTLSEIGAASSGHTHNYLPLSGGTITGQLYLTGLEEGSSDVTDNTELLTSYASNNGFSDTNATGKVYKRDAIHIYNYIKNKLDSVYSVIGHTHTYLPLSGGTITGTLNINRDTSVIHYNNSSGVSQGWLGFSAANTPTVWMANGSTKYNLIHSGNIGSQSVENADTVDGKHANDFVQRIKGTGSIVHYIKSLNNWNGIQITIPLTWSPSQPGMFAFTVRLYHEYKYTDIVISGYCYSSNHWFLPEAEIIGGTNANYKVKFGWFDTDDNKKLWVWIGRSNNTAFSYGGFTIMNVHCGHSAANMYEGWKSANISESELTNIQHSIDTLYLPVKSNGNITGSSGSCTGNAATATNVAWSGVTDKPNLVNSFGTKTGDITIRGGQTGNGSVNLAMSNNELQASIVGLGSNAYSSTKYLPLSGGDITGKLTINTHYDKSLIFDEPTGEKYHAISFRARGEEYAYLLAKSTDSNNILSFNGNIVYHSGNLSPMTTSHPANSITQTNINNWNAVHTWYTTATASDTTNTIDTWKEIEAFVSSFNKGDNLATYLQNNYLAKATAKNYVVTLDDVQTITGAKTFSGDFYVGGTSGSRCHIKMDTTNKCIKFIFD